MLMRIVGLAITFMMSIAWIAMVILAGLVLVFVLGVSQGQASEVWSPVPGTSASKNLEYIQKGFTIYRPIEGTRTPDGGSSDRWIIKDNKVYKALPGTNVPDYGGKKYLVR